MVDSPPTEEECWAEFWKVVGRAAAERYLREWAEIRDGEDPELGPSEAV